MKPFFIALITSFTHTTSQAAGPVVPGAGAILQQIAPAKPPPASPPETGLLIEGENGGKLPPSAPFEVKTIQISGNKKIDTAILHALVADVEGKNFTLPELEKLTSRLTNYYHDQGYPLARTIIPAQTITAGIVRLEIIEANYGNIKLENSSRASDSVLTATLVPLHKGDVIEQRSVDHVLMLLNDIPGLIVGATLKPGELMGTSDLLVNAAAAPAVSGNLMLDDYGNRYTGRVRLSGGMNINNPLHHGDILSINGLSSGGEMNYARIAYESLLNGQGTRLGATYSALRYQLGDSVRNLDAHGTAQVGGLWARHPFIRGQKFNLYGNIAYEHTQLRDHIDANLTRTDRHLGTWSVSLAGDTSHSFLKDSIHSWNLNWTFGRINFDDSAATLNDDASAKTLGRFSKINLDVSSLLSLNQNNTLYFAAAGQWANTNLDSSQKMTVGGSNSVRAYDTGALSGDIAYSASAEWRHDVASTWQSVVFIDTAHVTVNKNPWAAADNSATLSGAGVGLNWSGFDHWHARATLAAPIGPTPVLVATTKSVRLWMEIGRRF